ncbi:restriction endonuclease subunit S [Pseudomonas carnis]|jgi:type I restriction enzyme S subunit|uniref:Restriction endonuclease subunit S n=1 Tax=Pseudomonas carnis TaxID=2487355 RepID=A0ABT5RM99_9PSED|nr:restriction endonuclease subunit S [Pseudomonas carnis]MDD1946755.1 restriction endonuclease subunit S [Pseudomonas carnis]
MSELPNGWAKACIGDLADLNPKQAFDDETVAGFVPMSHAPTNFRDKLRFDERPWGEIKKAYTNFKDGDVIFAKVTPCFENGKAAFVEGLPNGVGAGSSEFFVLRPSCDGVSAKYLLALVKSYDFLLGGAENMTGAVGLRRVPKQFVERYLVPVAPAAEQTRIAAKLDELLTQVDTLKARIDGIPALLKRFRQSVLAAAVSGRLTEEWRAKNGAKIEVEGSTAETSEEFAWPMVRLGDVAVNFSYGSSAKSQPAGDIPVLRMGNIQGGRLVWDDLVFSSNPEELKKYSLQVGDVLFNRTNSPELVGKTATYKGEQPAIYAGYLIRVRCSERLISDFLNYCLNSPQGKDYCWQVKTDGVSQSNINAKKLADFRFGLPSTEEQTEIVRCVDQLFSFAERLEARTSDARTRIDRLTQSILAKALRGDLVPQDPNDEPAGLLLDRIKAQRAAAPKNKRGRRSTMEG